MRLVPPGITTTWASGEFFGDQRPVARATIQKFHAEEVQQGNTVYLNALFSNSSEQPVELPNIQTVEWQRSVDSDAGTCTLTLYNTKPLPIGVTPTRDLDQLGYYTFSRGQIRFTTPQVGTATVAQPQGEANEWQDFLVPDRIIRTYEGYGCDPDLTPENDPHLVLTGTWLVDTVAYQHDGLITVTCRDLGRLLLDQIMFPPVVPINRYPLYFDRFQKVSDGKKLIDRHIVANPPVTVPVYANSPSKTGDGQRVAMSFSNSSGYPYVGGDGSIYGHKAHEAFDDDTATYWLSIGNDGPNRDYSFEWIEGSLGKVSLKAFKFHTKWGGYRAYLSVFADGRWRGVSRIPYGHVAGRYVVQKGDYLIKIADKFPGVTWQDIFVANQELITHEEVLHGHPSNDPNWIFPGMTLDIPGHTTPDPIARNHADIPYVMTMNTGGEGVYQFTLSTPIERVTRVRLTLTNLVNTGIGGGTPYRAAVRSVQAFADTSGSGKKQIGSKLDFNTGTSTGGTLVDAYHYAGNYHDYTDIVKVLCAWGGFYWPRDAQVFQSDGTPADCSFQGDGDEGLIFLTQAELKKIIYYQEPDGSEIELTTDVVNRTGKEYDPNNNTLAKLVKDSGRVWGDFETTGTYGEAPLPQDIWDQKPLMDGVNYIKDIIGYVFFIDEAGAVIWRQPNIHKIGNYISDLVGGLGYATDRTDIDALIEKGHSPAVVSTDAIVTIDERQSLQSLTATLSSTNVREKVFIANSDGQIAAAVKGFNPYPTGLRRLAGWTDQYFKDESDALRMAELIALRQLFSYRTDQLVIAGYPAIQIDDQVRIIEQTTGEGYLHYVKGISSHMDNEAGVWSYTLDTHWLGTDPASNWVFDANELSQDTQYYIDALVQSRTDGNLAGFVDPVLIAPVDAPYVATPVQATYTTVAGDTLAKVSQKHYKTTSYWLSIWQDPANVPLHLLKSATAVIPTGRVLHLPTVRPAATATPPPKGNPHMPITRGKVPGVNGYYGETPTKR